MFHIVPGVLQRNLQQLLPANGNLDFQVVSVVVEITTVFIAVEFLAADVQIKYPAKSDVPLRQKSLFQVMISIILPASSGETWTGSGMDPALRGTKTGASASMGRKGEQSSRTAPPPQRRTQ